MSPRGCEEEQKGFCSVSVGAENGRTGSLQKVPGPRECSCSALIGTCSLKHGRRGKVRHRPRLDLLAPAHAEGALLSPDILRVKREIPWPTLVCPFQIDALTEVVAAVKGKIEVYLDGGIRTGNDVLKALALGAKCVFLGRPILWGLAYKVRVAKWKPSGRYHASHSFPCISVV